ncbi:GNAT family N-acetyltransferase [Priestia endophytica]|nr:GNAT family N-acetyltransferase [Priestia endophytica]
MNSITIRLVIQEDVLKMVPLMKEYIVDFYQRKQSVEKIKQHFTYLLAHQSQGVQYVAEHKGELIGFATLYFSFSTLSLQKNAILNDLYVSPSYRGKK